MSVTATIPATWTQSEGCLTTGDFWVHDGYDWGVIALGGPDELTDCYPSGFASNTGYAVAGDACPTGFTYACDQNGNKYSTVCCPSREAYSFRCTNVAMGGVGNFYCASIIDTSATTAVTASYTSYGEGGSSVASWDEAAATTETRTSTALIVAASGDGGAGSTSTSLETQTTVRYYNTVATAAHETVVSPTDYYQALFAMAVVLSSEDTSTATSTANSNSASGSGLSVGASVGIGIGAAVATVGAALGAWFLYRRRQRRAGGGRAEGEGGGGGGAQGDKAAGASDAQPRAPGGGWELAATPGAAKVKESARLSPDPYYELEGRGGSQVRHELGDTSLRQARVQLP